MPNFFVAKFGSESFLNNAGIWVHFIVVTPSLLDSVNTAELVLDNANPRNVIVIVFADILHS